MDLKQLRYFTRVAELGSFSKASAFLKVAQPALGRQIRKLEEEHKQPLFLRNGRGIETTEAGNRLLEHARGMLRLVDRIYEDIDNARTGKLGRVAIGMPPTLSTVMSTELVRRLWSQMPEVNVTILNGRSSSLQEWLLSGQLDMAVLLDAPSTPMLEIHEIAQDHLGVIGPESTLKTSDPITMAELAKLPLIISSRPNKIRVLLDTETAKIGEVLNVLLETDNLATGLDLSRDGYGSTVHTMRYYRNVPEAGSLLFRKIVNPEIPVCSQIAMPARRPVNPMMDHVFKILRELSMELLKVD